MALALPPRTGCSPRALQASDKLRRWLSRCCAGGPWCGPTPLPSTCLQLHHTATRCTLPHSRKPPSPTHIADYAQTPRASAPQGPLDAAVCRRRRVPTALMCLHASPAAGLDGSAGNVEGGEGPASGPLLPLRALASLSALPSMSRHLLLDTGEHALSHTALGLQLAARAALRGSPAGCAACAERAVTSSARLGRADSRLWWPAGCDAFAAAGHRWSSLTECPLNARLETGVDLSFFLSFRRRLGALARGCRGAGLAGRVGGGSGRDGSSAAPAHVPAASGR